MTTNNNAVNPFFNQLYDKLYAIQDELYDIHLAYEGLKKLTAGSSESSAEELYFPLHSVNKLLQSSYFGLLDVLSEIRTSKKEN